MALAQTRLNQQSAGAEPFYRKLHRAFFALCIVLAPLILSFWFSLCPQYGNLACLTVGNNLLGVLVAYRAANPLLIQIFLVINVVIPYLYPLSYIGLGLLSMKRAPWLSTIGIACGFVGSIPWGLVADQVFSINTMAHLGYNPLFALLEAGYSTSWETFVIFGGWVIGHQLAYVLLGIALARARIVPLWAAALIIVSAPVMGPLAYGTGLGILQILGYVMVFAGSIPAAFAMLKVRES